MKDRGINERKEKIKIMDKPVKIMLGISILLLIIFGVVVYNDSIQFQKNLILITQSLESSEPSKLQAAWFSVLVVRSVEFLVPSLIFGFGALLLHIRDNKKPKSKKKS